MPESEPVVINGDDGGGRIKSMTVNYTGNSHRAKAASPPEKEAIKPVVTGPVVKREKSFMHKASDAFFGGSNGSVTDYLLFEVFIPAAKNTIYDALTGGLAHIFGDSRRAPSGQGPRAGYTSYNTVRNRPESRVATRQRGSNQPEDLIVQTRTEAEEVIDGLRILINQFQLATVADYYALARITPSFTDDKWGWTDLRSANFRPVNGGYLIMLPPTKPLA